MTPLRLFLGILLLGGTVLLCSVAEAATPCIDGVEQSRTATLRRDELRRISDLCREEKNDAQALALLKEIVPEERLSGDTVLIGALEVALGQIQKETIANLLQVDPGSLAEGERTVRWKALLQGFKAQGDDFNALAVIDHSLPLAAAGERNELCREEGQFLAALSSADLNAFAGKTGETSLRYDLQTEQGLRALQGGDRVTAGRLLDQVLNGTVPFCRHSEALQLRDTMDGRPWLRRAIGVILPLREKFASFGEAVQRGIEMARSEHGQQGGAVFIVRDRSSDPEENRLAVEELVREERVMAILGPLTGGAALSAGQAAQEMQVPLLSLAQKDGLPELGDFVFRDALTTRNQVEALVRFAVEVEGRKRFAILAPENRLGQEFADLFAQAVIRHGGTLVGREMYAENDSDFRSPIKRLKKEDPSIPDPVNKEARNRVLITPPSPLPFDALFIPDIGERVALISSYLAYYGVENVQLLGTSAWNTPQLFEQSARYVEGAVFSDGFFSASEQPRVRDFVARYVELYGEEPSILEAEGYDLASLLLSLLERKDVRTRSDLRLALSRVRNYPGVTGEMTFGPFGDTIKSPFLLRIRNGALISAQ